MKNSYKLFLGAIVGLLAFSVYLGQEAQEIPKEMILSELIKKVESKDLQKLSIMNNSVISTDKSGANYRTSAPFPVLLHVAFLACKNDIKTDYIEDNAWLSFLRDNLVSILSLFVLLFFVFGRIPGIKNTNFKIKMSEMVTFDDVAGAEEAKEELFEVIEFLKNPKKYSDMGAKIPKGLILAGEPGTGKTLLAKAVASQAKCNFLYASGSQFEEIYVGVGASRIRSLFEEAKNHAPSIIFIDEIDTLGQRRNQSTANVGDQTLNEFLSQLDGFENNNGVIVFGATNRLDSMDPALIRAGRLGDRIIHINLPSMAQREEILKVHAKKTKCAETVDFKAIAKRAFGFSGADLAKIINEAALLAVKTGEKFINQEALIAATEKVDMGPLSKSLSMSQEEKERTAYHESGHAIMAKLYDLKNKIHQITVLPRSNALGYVVRVPMEEKDSYSRSKAEYLADVKVAFGGYAAEELMFGKDNVSSGPREDLVQANDILRHLVMYFGMSDLGLISLKSQDRDFPVSDDRLHQVEMEISKMLNKLYDEVLTSLKRNKTLLQLLSTTLMEKETMDSNEIEEFFAQHPLVLS